VSYIPVPYEEALVPTRLTFAVLPGGRSYELWMTPQTKPGWHIYGYQDGIEISKKPVESELRGRIEFERKIEEFA
jgi:hypothetical protein